MNFSAGDVTAIVIALLTFLGVVAQNRVTKRRDAATDRLERGKERLAETSEAADRAARMERRADELADSAVENALAEVERMKQRLVDMAEDLVKERVERERVERESHARVGRLEARVRQMTEAMETAGVPVPAEPVEQST